MTVVNGPERSGRRRWLVRVGLAGLAAALGRGLWPGRPAAEVPLAQLAASQGRDFGNFQKVYQDVALRREFTKFLKNVFHLYPEQEFDTLIAECVARDARDPSVYLQLMHCLGDIQPTLGALRYSLPALAKQKHEMVRQTVQLLGQRRRFEGYLELGSHGRYLSALREELTVQGAIYTSAPRPPTHSLTDVVDRESWSMLGTALDWTDYAPISSQQIPAGSLDLITVYIGFHHCAIDGRVAFIESLRDALSPQGVLILRDHDVTDDSMQHLVGLAHDVFNVGTDETWAYNEQERRNFYPLAYIVQLLEQHGFRAAPGRLLQEGDPTRNTLLNFSRA